MEDMQLYKAAVDSVKRYKEQGEELTDFEDFMKDIEREYGIQAINTIKGQM